MTKKIFITSMFVFILLPFSGKAENTDSNKTVKEIQKRYDSISNIQGNFTQDSYVKDLEEEQHYTGEFYIKMPSRLRWMYKNQKQEVIVNGSKIYINKKEEGQVMEAKFDEESYGQAPIALLAGLGNLSSDFTVTEVDKGILKLIPKSPMGVIKQILMTTAITGFPIKSLELTDDYGNKNTITVSNVKVNKQMDDSFFEFVPPENSEIFKFE